MVRGEGEEAAFPKGEEGLGARGEESSQVGLPEGLLRV